MHFLLQRRYWSRVREEWRRRKGDVARSWHVRERTFKFIDYYGDIVGTLPEKLLFNALMNSGIRFYFTPYVGDLSYTKEQERIRPDIIIPDQRIILEVIGDYWHTREGSYARDYRRASLLTAGGFTVYTIHENDILANPYEALSHIPALRATYGIPGEALTTPRPVDPRASLRAMQQKWPRRSTAYFKKRSRKWAEVERKLKSAPSDVKATRFREPLFETTDEIQKALKAEMQAFASEWVKYIQDLGDMFTTQSNIINYPTLYAKWYNWSGWLGLRR